MFPRRAACSLPAPYLHFLDPVSLFRFQLLKFFSTTQCESISFPREGSEASVSPYEVQKKVHVAFLAKRMRSRRAYRFTINDFPEFAVNGDPPGTVATAAAATVSERRFYPSRRSIRMHFPVCALVPFLDCGIASRIGKFAIPLVILLQRIDIDRTDVLLRPISRRDIARLIARFVCLPSRLV